MTIQFSNEWRQRSHNSNWYNITPFMLRIVVEPDMGDIEIEFYVLGFGWYIVIDYRDMSPEMVKWLSEKEDELSKLYNKDKKD